jgi:imidazole glycerol phosphate synthase subunit HisF
VSVPVIASGGIGSGEHVVDALGAGADAVLAASIFHDGDETVAGIKQHMKDYGMAVRL